ncbi:MAG: hypothetical protein V4712_00280 [Pseudomonadota bacterium]
MSAPHTNLEKQKRRHKGPLIGIALALLFGLGLMAYWSFWGVATGGGPGAQETTPALIQPDAAAPATDPVTGTTTGTPPATGG